MLTFSDLQTARQAVDRQPNSPAALFSALAEESSSVVGQLAIILNAIANSTLLEELSRRDFDALYETGTQILSLTGVDRRETKLLRASAELHLSKARFEALHGNFVEALWAIGSIRSTVPDQHFLQAIDYLAGKLFLRLGDTQVAMIRLRNAAAGIDADIKLEATRLEQIAQIFLGENIPNERLDRSLHLLQYSETRPQIITDRTATPATRLTNKLWTFAMENRQLISSLVRVETIQRGLAGHIGPGQKHLLAAVRALEVGYDNAVPLPHRIDQLRDVFLQRRFLPHVELELLLLASLFRFGQRFAQEEISQIALGEYQSLSERLSVGRFKDLLSLGCDVRPIELVRAPSGSKARAPKGELLVTAARGLSIVMNNRLRRFYASQAQKERLAQLELQKLSDLFCGTLGKYRGGLMKLGQVLDAITKLSPNFTTPWQRIDWNLQPNFAHNPEPILSEDFPDWRNSVVTLSELPIGIGSISQVFHARLRTGEELALKIKYPDVEKWFEDDFKLLNLVKPFLDVLLPSADLDTLLAKVRDMLRNELDFANEVRWQKRLRELFQNDPQMIIPEIYPELTSSRVIAMRYIKGRPLFPEVAEMPEARRSEIGLTIMRFVFKTLIEEGSLSADPHAANFLLTEDQRVAFLDFGAIQSFSKQFIRGWLDIIRAVQVGDKRALRDGFNKLGYFRHDAQVDGNELMQAAKVLVEPVATDREFVIDQEYLKRLSDVQLFSRRLQKEFAPPAEAVPLVRLTWGLFSMLAELTPRANYYKVIKPYLD